jgi:hypothetical protein
MKQFIFAFIIGIILWEFIRSNVAKNILGWLFIGSIFLSFAPVITSLFGLGLIFVLFHQFIAAGIMGIFGLYCLIFRVTNGFGVSF